MNYRRIWKFIWAPVSVFIGLVGLAKAVSWQPVKNRLEPVRHWMTASSWGVPHYVWLSAALIVAAVASIIVCEGLVRRPGRIRVGDRVRVPWMFGEMEGRVTRVWGPPGKRQISVEIVVPGGGTSTTSHAIDDVRLAPPRFRFREPRLGPELEPPF